MQNVFKGMAQVPLLRLREDASESERELFEARGRWWWARFVFCARVVCWLWEHGVRGWRLALPEAVLFGHWWGLLLRWRESRR